MKAPCEILAADRARLPIRGPSTEQLADAALLALSKLRDRLVVENANIPACRVDEAIFTVLAAARSALGIPDYALANGEA